LLNALLSIGVQPDRAREVVELFDRSVDERYGLHAQVIATKRDVAELETLLARDIAKLETLLARDIAALDNKLVQGLAECNSRIVECNSRIAEAKVDLVKWLLGALTAQTALIAGIVKLF
jgi:hypothetical protein